MPPVILRCSGGVRAASLWLVGVRAALLWLALVLSTTGAAAQPGGASQADPAEAATARRHFKMGVEFFRENNFGAALIEFKRAYEIVPHYKVLFNLGQTYIELQEYGKAVESLQGYLAQGGDELSERRRQQVEALIEVQRARLVTVHLECDEPGARVYVDETLVGTTPLDAPLSIGAGRRRIRLSKEGFVTAERRVDLGAGDESTLAFELEPIASAEDGAPTGPSAAPVLRADSGGDEAIWVAGIGTLLAGGATATMALLTASAEADLSAERGRPSTEARLRTLSDDVKLRAMLTDIGLGVTLAGAVVTTILLVTRSGDRQDADAATGLQLDLAPGHAMLHVGAHF